MWRPALVGLAVCLAGGVLTEAQQPAAGSARDLPIRRVVLYKSGIGYFEHVGQVTGDGRVAVTFTSPQLDDVLKTLTVLDLDGGMVSSVGYTSEAPLGRRLDALGLPVGEDATLSELLSALRGARVEARRGATRVSGRLLDVESRDRTGHGVTEQVDQASIITAGGEVHVVDLGAGTVLQFADAALNQRLNRYLETFAASGGQDRRTLTIETSGAGTRRLYVSYVSEAPVWKTTYRIVLRATPDATPMLQGWAIVDNTTGADWTDVALSLVAGAPQSFVQPLSQPLYTRRPHVPVPSGLLMTPQTHAATLLTTGAGGIVVDSSGGALPGVTVRVRDSAGRVIGTLVTDAAGRFSVPHASGRVRAELTLQGFASTSVELDAGSEARVVMRPQAMSETVTVTGDRAGRGAAGGRPAPRGVVGGAVGGVPGSAEIASSIGTGIPARASARELGELFEYVLNERVTVPQNRSAMVPVVAADIEAERVSLWSRADRVARPRRALWLTNTSGLTLDGGSIAVIDGETFAGEGLIETVKPGERRLVSYAMDLGMQVDADGESVPNRQQRLRIAHGVMTIETFECQQVRYTARNQDTRPRQLIIEHPHRGGWELLPGGPSPVESTATSHRFRLPVAPDTTAALVVSAFHPIRSSVAVGNVSDDQLRVYIEQGALNEEARAALEAVATARRALADLEQQIEVRQQEATSISEDQGRVRENMKSLGGSREERQLVERYVEQLDGQEDRLAALRAELDHLERQRMDRQRALDQRIEALSVEPAELGAPCR